MINKQILDELTSNNIIDKRDILWWQLDFEGRRVFTEEEFNQGLQKRSYPTVILELDNFHIVQDGKNPLIVTKEIDIWARDEVPILLRDIKLEGHNVPAFITVKPLSHQGGWSELQPNSMGFCLPVSVYHSPHIRGVVVEKTDEFLFWIPLTFGRGDGDFNYSSTVYRSKELELPALVSPICPHKFYKNLIHHGWSHGRRNQKKANEFDCNKEGYSFVPYYEFDSSQKHITLYPAPIFQRELDFPIVIKANLGVPEILGIGYFWHYKGDNVIYSWDLDKGAERKVKNSLITRLGRLTKK